MPSRADASFLQGFGNAESVIVAMLYQCPFGLRLHFYEENNMEIFRTTTEYQCPFGLMLHFYDIPFEVEQPVLKIVSMPSRAGTPFLHALRSYRIM